MQKFPPFVWSKTHRHWPEPREIPWRYGKTEPPAPANRPPTISAASKKSLKKATPPSYAKRRGEVRVPAFIIRDLFQLSTLKTDGFRAYRRKRRKNPARRLMQSEEAAYAGHWRRPFFSGSVTGASHHCEQMIRKHRQKSLSFLSSGIFIFVICHKNFPQSGEASPGFPHFDNPKRGKFQFFRAVFPSLFFHRRRRNS